MSELRRCEVCGLEFETSWGSDENNCNLCCESDTWNPEGVENPSEGTRVKHMYFTGEIIVVYGFDVIVELDEKLDLNSSEVKIDHNSLQNINTE